MPGTTDSGTIPDADEADRKARIREAAHGRQVRLAGRIVTGLLSTGAGVLLLVTAAKRGEKAADLGVEIGTATALSGVLWWLARRLRGAPPEGKTDVSSLLFPVAMGALWVWWALSRGATAGQVMLVVGSALVTVWVFATLELFFEGKAGGSLFLLPLAILLAPLLPLVAWIARDLGSLSLTDGPGPLDVKKRMTDLQIEFELDSGYDAELERELFNPTGAEVERRLGVSFPDGFIDWVTASQDHIQKWIDRSLIRVWPLSAVGEHPVESDQALVFFADCDFDGQRSHIAIDLRDNQFKGCLVRYGLHGVAPRWSLVGDPEILAGTFAGWRRFVTASTATFPEITS